MSTDVTDLDTERTDTPVPTGRDTTPKGSSDDTLLSVHNLKTVFRTQEGVVRAVDEVSFSLDTGEIVGLVGESGAGKSATADSILRLINSPGEITGGTVNFDGSDVLQMIDA
jgi:peptide/nickel transport system ATP-binding protein